MKSHDLYKKGWHPSSVDLGPTRRGTTAPINYAQAPYLDGGCKLLVILYCLNIREQTIWEILEFCYRNQILGLIYRIRADAHGILVFTC